MIRTLALAAAAACAAALVGPSPGPFPGYLCGGFQLLDSTSQAWQFDLTPIAAVETNYSVNGYKFHFAGCGISQYQCTSAAQAWPYAAGIQDFGACEVLSAPQAVPQWSLMDATNAAAGVQMTLTGARTGTSDGAKCPFDPRTGTEVPRTMVLQYACDASVPAGTLKPTAQFESPTCNYVVQASTAAACPVKATANPAQPLLPAGAPPVPVPAGLNAWGATGPFAPYLCNPTLKDNTGASYAFNLYSTYLAAQALGQDWNLTSSSDGSSYSFAFCGFTASPSSVCTPSYPVASNYGSAVHSFGGPATGSCFATNNSQVPCTPACHVLSTAPAAWSLMDSTNGASGGLTITYPPVETTASDPFGCPWDPTGLQPTPRQLTVNLKCDSTVQPAGTVVMDGVSEPSLCSYVATGRSAAACGTKQ